jgi:predicted DNA binding protein
MFKIQFKIYHKGCWGSEINLKFPAISFESVDCRWIKGEVAHILLSRGDYSQFGKIISYLNKRKNVTKVEVISKDKETMYLHVLTKKETKTGQFSDMFFQNKCFQIAPTQFKSKFEIWTLGTTKKKFITKIYNELKKKHPTKIIYTKEEGMEVKLTNKQRDALMHAKLLGYYEWPSKKTATQIAKILCIPKTVFLSHLRKAENKILTNHT